MDSTSFHQIVKLCMGTADDEREGLINFQQAQKMPNFATLFLKFLSDHSIPSIIKQSEAVRLKNYLRRFWTSDSDKNEEILIPEEEKKILKANILPLLSTHTDEVSLKIYMEIVDAILLHEYTTWVEFIPCVKNLMKSSNQNQILLGLAAFYKMKNYFLLPSKNENLHYHSCFEKISEDLENLLERVVMTIIEDNNIFSVETDHLITMKILLKILKIFCPQFNMGMPKFYYENKRIDRLINYVSILAKFNFPENMGRLNQNPTCVSD
jgi:hypothetical protein